MYQIQISLQNRRSKQTIDIEYNGWNTIHVFNKNWRHDQTIQIKKWTWRKSNQWELEIREVIENIDTIIKNWLIKSVFSLQNRFFN